MKWGEYKEKVFHLEDVIITKHFAYFPTKVKKNIYKPNVYCWVWLENFYIRSTYNLSRNNFLEDFRFLEDFKFLYNKNKENNNYVSLELRFDNKNSLETFIGGWLDGGLDGGGNLDWDTNYEESDKWDKCTPKWLRIKGTGNPYE